MPAAEVQVRIYCLGHFHAEKDGAPLGEAAGAQAKPLALLKTLIALGGEHVPVEQLTEALWPDSDGDAAYSAFTSALHRLRGLLGNDTLPIRQKRLSLDPRHIWWDCREVTALLNRAEAALSAGDPGQADDAMERAVTLYRGPFLEGEFDPPDILVARDKLHGRFLRSLREAATLLEQNGGSDRASRLYEKGIEADPVAEELYQCLLRAYGKAGRHAKAEAVYQRLCRNLEAQGGGKPSAETEGARGEAVPLTGNADDGSAQHCDPLSIAVLPLVNMSGDPDQDYFSDGITETIITILSKLRNLVVIARSSTFTYKGKAVDVRQVSRELGVRYVLEGSVQKRGDWIRVTAQLVDATTGGHVWAESFDRTLDDIFQLQDEITRQIVSAIDVKLVSGEDAIAWQTSTTNAKAYELFLQANDHYMRHNRESVAQAKACLEKALELDPQYAAALTLMGSVHCDYGFERWSDSPESSFECSGQYHQRALVANPALSEAYTNLAGHYWIVRREYDKAASYAERAVTMAPSSSAAHMMLGNLRCFIGDAARGLRDLEKARRLSPVPTNEMYRHLGEACFVLGRLPEALEYLRKNQDLNPEDKVAWRFLIMTLSEMGRPEAAQSYVQALLREMPYFTVKWYDEKFLGFVPDTALRTRMLDGMRRAGVPER